MHNIVFTIDSNLPGGAERVTSILANHLAINNKVTVINSDTESSFYKYDSKVKVIKMKLDSQKYNAFTRFLKKYIFLRGYFKKEHPDAVVTFLFHMEVPTILAALATKTRVFTSVRNSALSYTKVERFVRRLLYPHIGGIVFQSEKVKNFKDFKNIKNKIVIMNPLDIDIDRFQIVPYNKRKKWIINVGRLNHQKNQKLLIDAFDKIADSFEDYTLHIFGDGELKSELVNYINGKKSHSRIVLEGEVLNAIERNKDAFVFVLSSDFEGFPNVLAEAMAYGIPVLSTDFDSGVASQLIKEGENGFLCRIRDINDMSSKMEEIIKLNESEYMNIACKSKNVITQLNVEKICKQWENFIFKNEA